jgi:hypothetical protein
VTVGECVCVFVCVCVCDRVLSSGFVVEERERVAAEATSRANWTRNTEEYRRSACEDLKCGLKILCVIFGVI